MTADGAGTPETPLEPVGQTLARMRKAKHLTGAQLAAAVGMSQPKISRIERGKGLPDPEDIGLIAHALGADDALAQLLIDRAEGFHNRMADWRPAPAGLATMQHSLGEWEAAAQSLRMFEPTIVAGLLQTDGYARSIFAAFQRLTAFDSAGRGESAVLEAVSGRVQRQEIIADERKTFQFVMAETVLMNRLCPPVEMLAQIGRLRELAEQKNVSLSFVPDHALWALPPQHGFILLDDRLVVVDLYNTGTTTRGRLDIDMYQQIFDEFDRTATKDIEPILRKHEASYIALLRQPGASSSRPSAV
jgi:transcriptional regulator with XRE-family HTH domain